MSELMNNVRTVNSAARTVMLLALTGVVGFGGWVGYDNYVRPGFEIEETRAELARLQDEYEKQTVALREVEELNQRLETSMKLLKVDRRIANVTVMEKGQDESGEPYMEVRFTEVDQYGDIIGSPRDFTLQGDKFYVDGWVAQFEDKYVENADELRAASIYSFKSIYGDAEPPREGQRLDTQTVQHGAPGIYKSEQQSEFESQIWNDFWKVCNDASLQKELGIRSAHGQSSYVVAEEGKTYQVTIRSSGGMGLVPLVEVEEDMQQ